MFKSLWGAAGAMLVASAALAQVPPDVAARVAAIGRVVDVPGTTAIYAPLHTAKEPYAGVTVTRDLKFGPDVKQGLDLFVPTGRAERPRTVFVMVHGGGFVGGDKREPGSPFYDNVMLWAAKNGMIGVNVNYRLAPQNQYPAAQEDLAAAVAWVKANIARHGGDPNRVFMMGHSAGASHVATYVAHKRFHAGGSDGLKGAILSSGVYQVDPPAGPNAAQGHPYFGADVSTFAERSAEAGLIESRTPQFFVVAQLDPPNFQRSVGRLVAAKCATGECPDFMLLKDHGHISGNYAVNTSDESLSGPVLQFIRRYENR